MQRGWTQKCRPILFIESDLLSDHKTDLNHIIQSQNLASTSQSKTLALPTHERLSERLNENATVDVSHSTSDETSNETREELAKKEKREETFNSVKPIGAEPIGEVSSFDESLHEISFNYDSESSGEKHIDEIYFLDKSSSKIFMNKKIKKNKCENNYK